MSSYRAREVYRELQQLARADYGGATGSLLVVYGVEGFLRRLAVSDYATKMTLKGGMLMAATAARRMTKDADLSTVGIANDPDHIAQVVADVVTVELADDDGLAFDASTIRTEIMREQAEYQGVRVKIEVRLATARPTVALDFSFRDPHQSVVVDLPQLLGGSIRLASYPPADLGREDRDDDGPSGAQHPRSGLRRRLDVEPHPLGRRGNSADRDRRSRRASRP